MNDGSDDDTQIIATKKLLPQGNIRYIELSRNFGKEAALMAGLNRAIGDSYSSHRWR
jgi:glycosyltransferase involved in cell wall biosynthesis